MSRQNRKLCVSAHCVYTFFALILCLAHTACKPNDKKDKHAPSDQVGPLDESPPDSSINSDKFRLKLDENRKHTKSNKNFVTVTIIPGSSDMELSNLYITASVAGIQGTLKGSSSRKSGGGFDYKKDLNNQSLEELYLISANCLGKDDSSFKQGKQVQVKLQCEPGNGTPQGTEYTLTVKIERQGSNPHTEKSTVTLITK